MTGPVSDVTTELVRHALDMASFRHLVISNNIANANTPGYTPMELNFDGRLQAEMRDLSGQKSGSAVDAIESSSPGKSSDLESLGSGRVNLDWEVAKLSQNVVHYQSLLRGLSGKMAILAMAINEGRR